MVDVVVSERKTQSMRLGWMRCQKVCFLGVGGML